MKVCASGVQDLPVCHDSILDVGRAARSDEVIANFDFSRTESELPLSILNIERTGTDICETDSCIHQRFVGRAFVELKIIESLIDPVLVSVNVRLRDRRREGDDSGAIDIDC